MFSLELYKFLRSRQLVWMSLSLLIPVLLVFLGIIENESNYYYHPLFNMDDMTWLHFSRNYDYLLFFFFPLFLIVLYARDMYMDKEARLLNVFTMTDISKIRFWLTKYLFLQIITLIYILLYLCLPVFLYVLIHDPVVIGLTFFQTGLFLSLKSWIALTSITTIIFIIQVISPSFYWGIILPGILYIWLFILPGSPLALFDQSIHSFYSLSQDKLPFIWDAEHLKEELISLKLTSIVMVLFAIAAFILRRTTRFQHLLFGFIFIALTDVSCNQDIKDAKQIADIPMAAKDSFLVQWLDTAQVTDTEGQTFVLNDLLQSKPVKVLYLDFWSSYCVPCMKAFPKLNELSHQYSNEDLKIIYLNSDDESGRWEKALSFTGNLALADHYRILYPDFKVLAKVGLNIYPRYMVMNQKREIVEFRAPPPYEEYIDSLLVVKKRKL